MKPSQQIHKESHLQVNLNDLVHTIIRELSMAAKKTSIYGGDHPTSIKALGRPFFQLNKIFKFKKYVNLNLSNGNLYLLNIRLKDSIFTQEIIKYLQILDLSAVLFSDMMTAVEFGKFLNLFVKRTNQTNPNNLFKEYLEKEKIYTIEINTEKCYRIFDETQQYRGDAIGALTLEACMVNRLPDELCSLAKISVQPEEYAFENHLLDYDHDLVLYLIPEKISKMSEKSLEETIMSFCQSLNSIAKDPQGCTQPEVGKEIFRLLEYHPKYDLIIKNIENSVASDPELIKILKTIQTPSAQIRMESLEKIDHHMAETFSTNKIDNSEDELVSAFNRLLKTGQNEKALSVALNLVEYLESKNSNYRQSSLNILLEITRPLNILRDSFLFDKVIQVLLRKLFDRQETFEYSEFIWQLIEKCLDEKNYETMRKIMIGLNVRRRIENDVTVYDSIVVKKVYTYLSQPGLIKSLVDELLSFDSNKTNHIKEILIATGTNEVAIALSDIVTHSDRQVRQMALKILAELGKSSLKVFSQILMDDALFERENDRRELPDNKWYIVRNSIFVLGLIKDQEATIPLRLRISDSDVRVRREIITALEKIGGEEAVDILMMMVGDEDKEIRETAVISIGLIGTSDMAPLLIEMTRSNPKILIKAIHALGKLGGDESEQFLMKLLSDKEFFNQIVDGTVARDDARLAIVKTLATIGDKKAINTIKEYRDNLTTTQKIFFKNSQINKTIEEILSKD